MATEPAQSTFVAAVRSRSSQSLIGKGWIQGVALVMIFGFLVMGILAYRTYTASMPMPERVVSESGEVLFTGDQITRGQELFQARGLQEYGSVLGHGAYLGPDYTAEYLRMATDDVAAQFRAEGVAEPAGPGDRGIPNQSLRQRHRDAGFHRPPGRGVREHPASLRGLLRRELHQVRAVAEAHHRQGGHPRPDRVLRLDGVGVRRRAARPQLHLHQQLARRAASRQRADRGPDRVVGAVADRAARRHRHHVRRLRALEPEDRLAQRGSPDAIVPAAR